MWKKLVLSYSLTHSPEESASSFSPLLTTFLDSPRCWKQTWDMRTLPLSWRWPPPFGLSVQHYDITKMFSFSPQTLIAWFKMLYPGKLCSFWLRQDKKFSSTTYWKNLYLTPLAWIWQEENIGSSYGNKTKHTLPRSWNMESLRSMYFR